MNFWLLDPSSRLKNFREFRIHLQSLGNVEDKLNCIVEKWKYMPISARVIDPYSPDQWPTPWEIIHENQYDENAIAIISFHLLKILEISSELLLVEHEEKTFIKLIILVDDTYLLNYSYGQIDEKDKLQNCRILERWKDYSIIS